MDFTVDLLTRPKGVEMWWNDSFCPSPHDVSRTLPIYPYISVEITSSTSLISLAFLYAFVRVVMFLPPQSLRAEKTVQQETVQPAP
jgi:hypothetical protein